MRKGRMLVVEEDADIAKMLRLYFDSQGYEVLVTDRWDEALRICCTKLLRVVLLAAQLSGVDEFLDGLRSNAHTQYVPVIYLFPQDRHSDEPLELGLADDYLSKPFDIEELKRRVETVRPHWTQKGMTHPVTGLPADPLIEERLMEIKETGGAWVGLRFHLGGVTYLNEVVFYVADVMWETIGAYPVQGDFIGQLLGPLNEFVIITGPDVAPQIHQAIMQKFHREREFLGGRWGTPELSCQWLYLGGESGRTAVR
jgi:CheY-like chemotaxis protein